MFGLLFLFGALVLGYLLYGLVARSSPPPDHPETEKRTKHCPLCGSEMGPRDNVHTVVYTVGESDQLAEIHGCPRCRPPGGTEIRRCPVCKQTLGVSDFVHARYFMRPGKKHVHVLGCTRCYRRKQ